MDYKSNSMGFGKKPTITADHQKQPIIVQKLDIRPIHRKSQDIGSWRTAIRQAESLYSNRVNLYNLYHEILLDGHLLSVIEKRLLAVANAKWEFVDKNGDVVESVMEWIDTHHFEKLVREIANTKMWGYTMIELDFYKEDGPGVFLIPRKHMRPELGAISVAETGWNVESIRTGRYARRVLEVGEDKDLGLLMSVAQYIIYKRGNIADWAQFIEVFGQPLVDAVWDGFDENQRQLLLQALENMGGGGQIVRPEGTELTMIDGKGAQQSGDLWMMFMKSLNGEISKTIIGQTETTESSTSSGYGQAKQHAETEDDINKADKNYVRRILNGRLRKLLELNGWDLKGGHFRIADQGEAELTKRDQMEIALQIRGSGTPISDDYFYENYGIDKPDNYDEMVAEREQEKIEREKVEKEPPPPSPPTPSVRTPKKSKGEPTAVQKKPQPKMKVLTYPQKRTLITQLRDFFTPPL